MSKFKIIQKNKQIFTLLCTFLIIKLASSSCPYPFERCICSGSTPLCPCSQLTSTQTVNSSSSYFSHLVLVNGYGCRPCPPSCRKCTSTQVCTECFDQFQLISNLCVPCPINCKKCKTSVCQSCIDGYYIDYQQKCQKCPLVGTKMCTIDSLISCLGNYWMDNNGATCVNCDVNCKVCSSTTKCSTCIDGYYEMNYACYKCKEDCATCTNGTSCLNCSQSGFFFNSTLGTCMQCPGENCIGCNSNGTCTLCDSLNNFYLNKTSRQCIKYSNTNSVQNCRNLTFTSSSNLYNCENCQNGYYSLSDYNGASLLTCFYGCSLVCNRCSGPHYGLCDECISDADFSLWNRHCIPKYNLNDGSAFQLLYTALNNVSFFEAPTLIAPDSCWHEYVKGGSSSVTFRLFKMSVYKLTLKWKIYKYNFQNSSTIDGIYALKISNTLIQNANLSHGYSFQSLNCINKIGFSSLCLSGQSYQCTDKNQIDFESLVTANDNVFTFSSENSLLAISELLVIGYRCGGVYGDGCIQCTDINTCTKCSNPNFYLIAQKCISQCPNTYYTYEEFKKCVQICPSGSYSDDILHQCFTCISPCETCISSTQCLTCKQGFFYDSLTNQCKSQCPSRYYKENYRRICEKCSNPCFTCLDSLKCTSCREGFLNVLNETINKSDGSTVFYGECVLQCPEGMYTDLLIMKCQNCSSPCKTCTFLPNQCTSCVNNYFLLDYSCLSQCPQNYYKNQESSKCSQCDSNCKNCLNLTYCYECRTGFYLNADNVCITSCIGGYYQEQVPKKCLKCKDQCLTCNSKDICTSCVTNFFYLEANYSCVSKCPKFYYSHKISLNISFENFTSICNRCQLPCYECSSETYCLSCYDAFLHNGSCLIACPSTYFANLANLKCQKCDQNLCLQCKNTESQCTKCHQGLLLVNGNCLSQCPQGFYFSNYKSQCILCEGLCDTCLNSTFCLTCIEGFSLWKQGQCVNSCQTGFYRQFNSSTGGFKCTQCPQECEACIFNDTIKIVQCLVCNSKYSFFNRSCLLNCPNGYFENLGQCIKCMSPCQTCKDQQYCLSCLNGFGFFYEGTCVSSCPYGYYSDQKQCNQCDKSCLLCEQSPTNCIACKDGLFKYSFYTDNNQQSLSVCSLSCPDGYFKDESNSNYDNMCQKCLSNCKTCRQKADKCFSCNQGMILYKNQCLKSCPIETYFNSTSQSCTLCGSNCLYCLSDSSCIQCQSEYFLDSNKKCIAKCFLNQYGSEGICKKCLYPCKSCKSQEQCLSCIVGISYISEYSCLDSCIEGSYYVKQNGKQFCRPCKVNCSRCVNQKQCLFCQNGLYLHIGTCVPQCPDGYYGNFGFCVKCDQNCLICQNSHTCLKCVNGTYLLKNKCIAYCPVGYFASNSSSFLQQNSKNSTAISQINVNSQSSCEPCAIQCTKCYNSSKQCTQCARGYYIFINSCLLSCPSGSYASQTLKSCQPCVSPCQTCTNSFSCESCIYGYLLYRQFSKNQCVEGPSCPNNYYLNTDQKICEFICPQNYYVSQSTRTCSLSCPDNLVTLKSNMSCLQYCPQNMWIDHNLQCKSKESQPSNLPYLSCSSLTVRNLLFVNCLTSSPVVNLNSLKIQNIQLNFGQVSMIKVKSVSQFYLLVQNIGKILRNEEINLELLQRYELKSKLTINTSFLKSNKENVNVLKQKTKQVSSNQQTETNLFPVQNYKLKVFISEYIPYSISQREIGISFYQIGQSISYAGLIIWIFCLLKNVKVVSLVLLISMQWLYSMGILLSGSSLAPNVNQFLQGFKYSSLIDIISLWPSTSNQQNLWTVTSFIKPQYWAINNLYSFQQSLTTVYIAFGVFSLIYVLTLALSKTLTQTWIDPDYENLLKMGKKAQLINQRFYSNYFFHLLLLTISPISLLVNIQLTSPNVSGLIQSIIIFFCLLGFVLLSVYFFAKWKAENIKKNRLRFMMFFYLSFGTTTLNSILVVWSTFYLYVGFCVTSIVLNMIAWHLIYRQTESKRCSYLQLIQLFKGFIIIVFIIGDIKRQKWSQEEMFYFGFVQIAIIIMYILLSSVFIAEQLFRPDHPSTKKHQKPLQQSLLKQQSYKTANFPQHYSSQKEKDKTSQQRNQNQIIREEQIQQEEELSFFSNRTPLSQSDSQSVGDIIDFDQSEQHNNQSSRNKINLPPKNLYKYDKNS